MVTAFLLLAAGRIGSSANGRPPSVSCDIWCKTSAHASEMGIENTTHGTALGIAQSRALILSRSCLSPSCTGSTIGVLISYIVATSYGVIALPNSLS